MNYWIISQNEEMFHLEDLLKEHDVVDWKQYNNFEVGDIVYIYNSKPYRRIRYKMEVVRTDVPSSEYINDTIFWVDKFKLERGLTHNRYVRLHLLSKEPENGGPSYDYLRSNGLKSNLQSAVRILDSALLRKIQEPFRFEIGTVFGSFRDNSSDEITDLNNEIAEGAKLRITVNRYERSNEARRKCIEANGCRCVVCGFDFKKVYGKIGEGFIHVHHIKPIAEIGESYVVNPATDLVPVCPNCHAMLHHSEDENVLTVEELKKIMRNNENHLSLRNILSRL